MVTNIKLACTIVPIKLWVAIRQNKKKSRDILVDNQVSLLMKIRLLIKIIKCNAHSSQTLNI